MRDFILVAIDVRGVNLSILDNYVGKYNGRDIFIVEKICVDMLVKSIRDIIDNHYPNGKHIIEYFTTPMKSEMSVDDIRYTVKRYLNIVNEGEGDEFFYGKISKDKETIKKIKTFPEYEAYVSIELTSCFLAIPKTLISKFIIDIYGEVSEEFLDYLDWVYNSNTDVVKTSNLHLQSNGELNHAIELVMIYKELRKTQLSDWFWDQL